MIKYTHLVLAILLGGFFNPAYAVDTSEQQEIKYYDVEVIVFKNLKVPRSHEFNLPTPAATRTENTLDLSKPESIQNARKSGFTPLKSDELRLHDSVQRITKSSRYQLLLHTGWRQPGLDEKSSIPVWVKGGKIFDSSYSSIDQMAQLNKLQNDERQGKSRGTASLRMQGLYELEGQITIILSRYLHTRTELVLRKPEDETRVLQQGDLMTDAEEKELFALEGQLLLNYSLNEQRRMRSKKLHYLDHPQFGMLVLITPYLAPEEGIPGQQEVESASPDVKSENRTVN